MMVAAREPRMARFALLLLLGCVASALGLVVVKHHARQAVTMLESQVVERDRIAIEWARLQLEEGARASQGRVESTARDQLTMYLPTPAEVKVVR